MRLGRVMMSAAAGCLACQAPAQVASGTAGVPASVRGPLLQPIAPGSSVEHVAPVGRNLRLRVAVAAAQQGPRERIHQRIASSMIDFYPVGTSGFHLSAGTRMYDPRAGEQLTNRGLITAPRQLNVPGGRAGLRRTPALTMGYTGEVADRTSLGVEVGAMRGRVYSNATDAARLTRAERGGRNPVNPMVNLVVGRRF